MMASDDDALATLKVLLIGPSGAGKSALLIRYCDDEFDSESSTATIGIDFKIKKLSVRGKPYRLTLFDTAGQERFRTLSTSFYRGAHGVLLVYDISSRASFLSMDKWFEEAESNAGPDVVLYLVGTKLDKAEVVGRAVSTEEGEELARQHGALFCEVSAKTGEEVRRPFIEVVDGIIRRGLDVGRGRTNGTVRVGANEEGQGGYLSGCAC